MQFVSVLNAYRAKPEPTGLLAWLACCLSMYKVHFSGNRERDPICRRLSLFFIKGVGDAAGTLIADLEGILASTSSNIVMYVENCPSSDPWYSGRSIEMAASLAEAIKNAVQNLEAWHSSFLQRLFLVVLLGEPFAEPNVFIYYNYERGCR